MAQAVTTAFKASNRSAHPQHPASTAVAADSGNILGYNGQKLTNGAQRGATKDGEVSADFD